jgi:hypothetical protein
VLASILLVSAAGAAWAQGFQRKDSNLPDASRFYMARQQWQVTTDDPVVSGSPAVQGAPAGASLPGAGPMSNNSRPPLPRAGWQPYSQMIPGLQTSLPRTNNGVPPKLPTRSLAPAGMQGRGGSLANRAVQPVRQSFAPAAPAVRSYAPYKGCAPQQQQQAAMGANNRQSSENVMGSVLHWARAKHY